VRVEFGDRRAWPWQLVVAIILVVLLATLGAFQYRWLGEVSQAESERMRASLRTRASDLSQEFDREITRTYVAFQLDPDAFDRDAAGAIGAAYSLWKSAAVSPSLVSGVYLLEGRAFDSAQLRRFDLDRQVLEPSAWPPALAESLKRADRRLPQIVGTPPMPMPIPMVDAVDSRALALIVPVPRFNVKTAGRQLTLGTDAPLGGRVVVVQLDADALQRQILQPLVAKYFGDGETSEYLVTIARRDDPAQAIYSSSGGPVTPASADVTTGLFDLRLDQVSRFALASTVPPPGAAVKTEHMAITIVRRGSGPDASHVLMSGGESQGAWQLRARHRSGSLDAIVARSRRRNLAISLGVLGLLGASVILVMAASQRQRRLSRQQMEFVASVSHELRTPLAVICSAGENLADGVVADAAQVKKYGSLIETEGRRLGDMVERVMEFAGISAGNSGRTRADVDIAKVIADAVHGVSGDARDRGVTVNVHPNGALPPVTGDPDALRSAVQNIVGNAVKYSPSGGSVDVTLRATDGRVRIQVVDRGLGIDAEDLPHIFEPFYRGRRAVEAQVRGSGVGLSVVRHVIDAHHATIAVDSRAGEGTTVTVQL
jgi:signal transduction histidine kinase